MVREILKIYTDNGLSDNPAFHDIEIAEYEYKPSRMGMPTLTATLMWKDCLDKEWTGKEYVELRGERFYIRHIPTSSKSNTDARYKHELDFRSELDEILSNIYFEDYVPSGYVLGNLLTHDKPCSNSPVFQFYGTIREFSDRLNCAFIKAGIGDSILKTKTNLTTLDTPKGDGYCSMIDAYGDLDEDKSYEFSFDNQTLWEAITSAYNTTEIPFERRGRKIIWGAVPKVLSKTFKYGHNNELLSISKNNANAKVVNRITMFGSPDNLPYYYPNETEYGNIKIQATSGNKVITDDKIEVANQTQVLAYLPPDTKAVLGKYDDVETFDEAEITGAYYFAEGFHDQRQPFSINDGKRHGVHYYAPLGGLAQMYYRIKFTVPADGHYDVTELNGFVWWKNSSCPAGLGTSIIGDEVSGISNIKLTWGDNDEEENRNVHKIDGTVSLGYLKKGIEYSFRFLIQKQYRFDLFIAVNTIKIKGNIIAPKTGYYWDVDGKTFDGESSLGIKIKGGANDSMIGDSFQWTVTGRMPFQDRLVPPKYRNTEGAERFYNALNFPYSEDYANAHKDAYIDPDTDNPYEFTNPYIEGAPSEYIYNNEDIKPTIEGVENSKGLPFGVIADIDFDTNDNDSLKADVEDGGDSDTLNYEHSYFYIRLNQFDGEFGFDLFRHASQKDPMTIQMTSGTCNGCKFEVQAVEFKDESGLVSFKNPVQVNSNGEMMTGDYKSKISDTNFIDSQQDTTKNSIWLCVKKDVQTFGVVMPNQEHKYLPKKGDTFNIINIELPDAYIRAAEKRLEEEGMRYMSDNNEEKFTFDINSSRIFFAEHPEVLSELDEYSKIRVEYDGKTYELFVSSLTINCKNNEPLPEIKIDLTDTIAIGPSFQERMEERAQSLIASASNLGGGSGGAGGLSTALADRRYISKQKNDRTPFKLSSDVGFEVGSYFSGGSGGIFYQDPETGQTYIETDKLKVRMKAIFEELEIANVSSIGGEQEITPGGGIDISYIEELDDVYRCYFKAAEEDKGAKCRFIAGDQVKCQEFNIQAGTEQNATNKYYWRLVVAVNNDESYVDISKSDCDKGSDAPEVGDTIVQLGNRTDKKRQSAIVHSTVDAFAPCVTLYDGIESYSLEGKEVIQYGVDKTKNPPQPFFHCYGSFYYGPKNRSSYLEFDPSLGYLVFKGTLLLQSTVTDDKGNSQALQDYLDNLIKDNTLSEQEVEDIANTIADAVKNDLQKQIDGAIETWYAVGVPTLTNYPANEWRREEYAKHEGDLYYDKDSGLAYRFMKDNNNAYKWILIQDMAVAEALGKAEQAQNTANSKATIFINYPGDNYHKNDLWFISEEDDRNQYFPSGIDYPAGTLLVAVYEPQGGFSAQDWQKKDRYTDDTYAHTFDYLSKALEHAKSESTIVEGGLVLSTLIELGMTNPTTLKWEPWSGISGAPLADAKKGYGIAAWYGGDMIDKEVSPEGRYAQSLFRFDGSGYLAGGRITWDALGNLTLNSGIEISSGESLGSIATSIASFSTLLSKFTTAFRPIRVSDKREVSWGEISNVDTELYAIRAVKGFYSDEFISSVGLNPDMSSDSKGGVSELKELSDVSLNALTLADGQALIYRNGVWVNEGGYLPLTGGTLTGKLNIRTTDEDAIYITGTNVNALPAYLSISSWTYQQYATGTIQTMNYNGSVIGSMLRLNPLGGYVGIGVAYPQSALHVNGDVTVSSGISASNANISDANVDYLTINESRSEGFRLDVYEYLVSGATNIKIAKFTGRGSVGGTDYVNLILGGGIKNNGQYVGTIDTSLHNGVTTQLCLNTRGGGVIVGAQNPSSLGTFMLDVNGDAYVKDILVIGGVLSDASSSVATLYSCAKNGFKIGTDSKDVSFYLGSSDSFNNIGKPQLKIGQGYIDLFHQDPNTRPYYVRLYNYFDGDDDVIGLSANFNTPNDTNLIKILLDEHNIIIGDESSYLNLISTLYCHNDVHIKGDVLPWGTYSLGASTARWSNLYANALDVSNGRLTINSGSLGDFLMASTASNYAAINMKATSGASWSIACNQNNYFYLWNSTNSIVVTVLTDGNVGIGTTSPTYKLHVNGTIGAAGTVSQNVSDIRLKTDINSVDCISQLMKMGNVFTYRYNALAVQNREWLDMSTKHTGIAYQNAVKAEIPDFTGIDEQGYGWVNFLSNDYQATVLGALMQTILRQYSHENEISSLKQRISELEKG